jgi:hypothetical protein
VLAKGGSETSPDFRGARGFCGSGVGLNPIGVAAGVKNVGDEPMLVEFTKPKRNESASVPDKKTYAPTVRVGAKNEFRSLVRVALLVRAGMRAIGWRSLPPLTRRATNRKGATTFQVVARGLLRDRKRSGRVSEAPGCAVSRPTVTRSTSLRARPRSCARRGSR